MKSQPTSPLAYMVVGGQVAAFLGCVASLSWTLFHKNYSDPVVLTALIGLTGTLAGNMGSILGGPRMMMLMVDTIADKVADKISEKPVEAKIINPPSEPIPTVPQTEVAKPSKPDEPPLVSQP